VTLDLSKDVQAFFELHIDSVETLHVMILLQSRPETVWTTRAISDELRSSESSVTARVRALVDRKVMASSSVSGDGIHYEPYSVEMGSLISEALEYYRQRPYRVVELIFSKRTQAIRSIADAFRFRKED
jgi:hypothetical protein